MRLAFGDEVALRTKQSTFQWPDPKCRASLLASHFRSLSSPSEVYFKLALKDKHDPYCTYAHKKVEVIELSSPEQAKDCLLNALGYLYKHLTHRLDQLEKKVGP